MNVSSASPRPAVASEASEETRSRPLLTVVVPVYNGGDDVVANIGVIHEAVASGLPGEHVEIVVVSDGSIDGTAERLLETREQGLRVIHYDRNLGKGYAVKSGALASHGSWVALVDADLDLDPASIPTYLAKAREEKLDFVIGSKRHPDSVVHYPRSRRIASWCYQRLNRVLFRLDVRDTQVGLKVFSRDVADDVIPILLVKQFAFDLELLAVGTSLGYGRIAELPVRLDYRFTGSGVGSVAVLRALWDTAAIFYRLRILRTYARRRRLLRLWDPDELPIVSVVGDERALASLDYPRLSPTGGEVVAVLGRGARPAGNWISATIPYFADSNVAAVVAPTVAPLRGSLRERVAAAVLESRLGSGSRRLGYLPGNVREVVDYPADTIVIRSADQGAAHTANVDGEHLVAWLAEHGRRTIYTPDTSISAPPSPLVGPHLATTFHHARARGSAARRSRGGSLSLATALSLAPLAAALIGIAFVLAGGSVRTVGFVFLLAYAAALCLSGAHAAFRFHSFAVGVLQPFAVIASQATYLGGFVRGLSERSRAR